MTTSEPNRLSQNGAPALFDQDFGRSKDLPEAISIEAGKLGVRPLYDPFDTRLGADPNPTYRDLLENWPVFHDPADRFWALSRFHDVQAAFADAKRFTSIHGVAYEGSGDVPSILEMDPPVHTRYRQAVARWFTRTQAERGSVAIRGIARAAVAALPCAEFDFVTDLAASIPMALAGWLLGLRDEQLAELRPLIDCALVDVGPAGKEAMTRLSEFTKDLVQRRKRVSTGDLAGDLCQATIGGESMSEADASMICMMILLGGQEPVSTLIGGAACVIDAHPEVRRAVVSGHASLDAIVEEVARLISPTQYMTRTATTDIAIGDTTIPAGARVVLLIAAANRDERRFESPDTFWPGRPYSRSLAFGCGPHTCLGQWMTRVAVRVVLEEVYLAFPGCRIDPETVGWRMSGNVRRLHAARARGGTDDMTGNPKALGLAIRNCDARDT